VPAYERSFSVAYQERFGVREALKDIGVAESLSEECNEDVRVYREEIDDEFVFRVKYYSCDVQAEQELLAAFSKEMSIASTKYSLREIADGTEEAFVQKLSDRYMKVYALLAEKKGEGVSADLIGLLEGRIKADEAQTKIYYPEYYEYLNKEKPTLSDDYYAFLESFDFNNEGLFQFDDVKYAGLTLLAKDLNFEDYDNMTDYYGDQYKLVDGLTSNSKIAELLKFEILSDKINYSGGISGLEDGIQKFIDSAKDPLRVAAMSQAVAMWSHLKVGNEAPDFTAMTRDGEEVKLSDLKGKNVYIDVWATWCGPCIREIPALKQMEKKYHNENIEFVSVSIDKESDREKWKKFVEEKELGGTQIMANEAGSADLSGKYNISGIPRFIMVDSNGSIVNVDAPRPSNKASFDKMVAGVLN